MTIKGLFYSILCTTSLLAMPTQWECVTGKEAQGCEPYLERYEKDATLRHEIMRRHRLGLPLNPIWQSKVGQHTDPL